MLPVAVFLLELIYGIELPHFLIAMHYYHDLLNTILNDPILLMHRWNYHGRPPGGDVSYISDAGNLRPGTLFTIRYTKHEVSLKNM